MKDLIKNKNTIDYDNFIDILLTNQTKEIKKPTNKIALNLMLSHLKNDEIYQKYNSLIPNNSIPDTVFDDLNMQCFDLNINKQKLSSSVILNNKSDYDDMHNHVIDILNTNYFKQVLGLYCVDGETKFKSSKHYRYIVRLNHTSSLTKDSVQLLFLAYFDIYSDIILNKNRQERYDAIRDIQPEQIMNRYLTLKLSKEQNDQNKTITTQFKI